MRDMMMDKVKMEKERKLAPPIGLQCVKIIQLWKRDLR